jgi:hypothetical protein
MIAGAVGLISDYILSGATIGLAERYPRFAIESPWAAPHRAIFS